MGVAIEGHKSGIKPHDKKCRSNSRPGMHQMRRGGESDFAKQKNMKRLIRDTYCIKERKMRQYYKKAAQSEGSTPLSLYHLLETRLDNLVFRLGFACTRPEARQLVLHKHININGRVLNIPSYHVRQTDVIEISEKAIKHLRIAAAMELHKDRTECPWIQCDASKLSGGYAELPGIDTIPEHFKLNLVVEFYSK